MAPVEPRTARERYDPWARALQLSPDGVQDLDEYGDALDHLSRVLDPREVLYRGELRYYPDTWCQPGLARLPGFETFAPLSASLRHLPGPGPDPDGADSVVFREEVDILNEFAEQFRSRNPTASMPSPHASAWLDLAQHHGQPTRLLDVTRNPLVALFFACWSPSNVCDDTEPGMVYFVSARRNVRFQTVPRADFNLTEADRELEVGIADSYLDFFEPWILSRIHDSVNHRYEPLHSRSGLDVRLGAQSGEFIWTRRVTRTGQWLGIMVPAEAKAGILRRLATLKIEPRVLFPDALGRRWAAAFDAWMSGQSPDAASGDIDDYAQWTSPGTSHWAYSHLFTLDPTTRGQYCDDQ